MTYHSFLSLSVILILSLYYPTVVLASPISSTDTHTTTTTTTTTTGHNTASPMGFPDVPSPSLLSHHFAVEFPVQKNNPKDIEKENNINGDRDSGGISITSPSPHTFPSASPSHSLSPSYSSSSPITFHPSFDLVLLELPSGTHSSVCPNVKFSHKMRKINDTKHILFSEQENNLNNNPKDKNTNENDKDKDISLEEENKIILSPSSVYSLEFVPHYTSLSRVVEWIDVHYATNQHEWTNVRMITKHSTGKEDKDGEREGQKDNKMNKEKEKVKEKEGEGEVKAGETEGNVGNDNSNANGKGKEKENSFKSKFSPSSVSSAKSDSPSPSPFPTSPFFTLRPHDRLTFFYTIKMTNQKEACNTSAFTTVIPQM